MTNPSNMVRVRARNGGRASVYEANGWAQVYTQGLLEGNGVTQNTVADMNVLVGGSATKPDVLLATNPAGYKVALDLVSQQAIAITAPASNKRISAIVAYTDDLSLPTTEDTVTGAPASCGLIVVNGTAAANPTEPTDNQIRTAITSDGATGSQAAYCVIATILVASGTTAITNDEITVKKAGITSNNIDFTTFSVQDLNFGHYAGINTFSLGYGITARLSRIGNLVIIQGSPITNQSLPAIETTIAETIPAGYRPTNPSSINAICGSEPGKYVTWWIAANGTISMVATSFTGTASRRINISSAWFTQDEWPS